MAVCIPSWCRGRGSEILPQKVFGGVSLAQLVGGVDVQTQHLSSNPHGGEVRFLFILEDQAFLVLIHLSLMTRLGV